MSPVIQPRIVLCVPGRFESLDELRDLVDGVEYELHPHDPRMVNAFRHSLSLPVAPDEAVDLASIDTHRSVLYALSPSIERSRSAAEAHFMLRAGAALLDAGGLGIKCESSGIAHSPRAWHRLNRQANDAHRLMQPGARPLDKLAVRYEFWGALFDAFVRRAIVSATDLYTCGMHLLGEPDVIIASDFAVRDGVANVADVMEFANYLLAESEVATGQTFGRGPGCPKFVLSQERCATYEDDDFFFNPYGYWRLSPMD